MQNLSATRKLRHQPRPTARSKGQRTEQTAIPPGGMLADGFLRHSFLPLYEPGKSMPPITEAGEQYFRSLEHLYASENIARIEVSDKPYPYNVLLSHWNAERVLSEANPDLELSITRDEENNYCLSSRESLNTGMCLYYIPVIPLYHIMENRKTKRAGEILLSVFAYLYRVACIPYYRDPTYVGDEYEILADWIQTDNNFDEEEQLEVYISQFNAGIHYGDIMRKRMRHPRALVKFGSLVERFSPKDDFERDCLRVAEKTLALYKAYPTSNIYSHVTERTPDEDDEDYDYYQTAIRIDEYISFIADTKGKVYNSLFDMINGEFQERGELQEPKVIHHYNGECKTAESLDFERRLIGIIDDLCTLLND